MRTLVSSSVLSVAICFGAPALAQEAETETPSTRFLVTQVVLEPSRMAEADAAWLDMMREATAGGYDAPLNVFKDGAERWYSAPIGEDYAGLDAMFDARRAAIAENEAFEAAWDVYSASRREVRSMIVTFDPELSYRSEDVREEGENYMELFGISARMGYGDELEDIMAEWRVAHETAGIERGYWVYSRGIGDVPGYYVVSYSENPVDAATRSAAEWEALEAAYDVQDLMARTNAVISEMSERDMWYAPDISLPLPPQGVSSMESSSD